MGVCNSFVDDYVAPTWLDIFWFWFYKDSAPTELTDET